MSAMSEDQMKDLVVLILDRKDLPPWRKCAEIDKATKDQNCPFALDIQRATLFVVGLLGGWRDIISLPDIWQHRNEMELSLRRIGLDAYGDVCAEVFSEFATAKVDISNEDGIQYAVNGYYEGEAEDDPALRRALEGALSRSGCDVHEGIMEEFVHGLGAHLSRWRRG
jgi:hypothetical protein